MSELAAHRAAQQRRECGRRPRRGGRERACELTMQRSSAANVADEPRRGGRVSTAAIAALSHGAGGAASAVIGALGVRFARSTSDFLVASRTVGPAANAGAISGEYLSAASFLGIAGLILRDGVDALWYPVGVHRGLPGAGAVRGRAAAPLRRLHGARLRRGPAALAGAAQVCTAFVVVIGWLYLLPQLQGAGLTLTTVTGCPPWMGRWRRRSSSSPRWCSAACGRSRSCRRSSTGSSSPRWLIPAADRAGLLPRHEPHVRPAGAAGVPRRAPPSRSTPTWCCRSTAPVTSAGPPARVDGVDVRTRRSRWAAGPAHRAPRRRCWGSRRARRCRWSRARPPTDAALAAARSRRAATYGLLGHLLADHRHVPGHDGPAARARALLHQPRRPGRPPHRRGRARPARRVLRRRSRCSARSPGSTPRSCWSAATPTPRCCCCPRPCWAAAGPGRCSARSWRRARGRRSCRRRRGSS